MLTITPPPSSGGGNATVPVDAPILPAQAFVDNIAALSHIRAALNLSNKSITHFSAATLLYDGSNGWMHDAWGVSNQADVNLSGNALSASEVNGILAAALAFCIADSAVTNLDLSGGTNAAPTGQGITDKQSLIDDHGSTVLTN